MRLGEAEQALRVVAAAQAGILTRRQAVACGLSDNQLRRLLAAGRWRRVHRGVYATFTGPLPRRSVVWAGVLCAGAQAVLSHETSAELWGLVDRPSRSVHVMVPEDFSPAPIAGVVIHRSDRAVTSRHPTRMPPQTRVEDTVIDLTQTAATVEDAIGWLARAVAGRFTTAPRLAARLRGRGKVRWRALLRAALDDIGEGCHSLLELAYLREVERAHGLPRSERQARRRPVEALGGAGVPGFGERAGVPPVGVPTVGVPGGESRPMATAAVAGYDDVRYREYATRVELDGRAAHPEHERWRDMRRDNATVVDGDRVLRYGQGDIESYPCHAAAQVSAVLRLGGWRSAPTRCPRPDCAIP